MSRPIYVIIEDVLVFIVDPLIPQVSRVTPGWQNGQGGYKRVFTGSDIVCLAIQAILVNTLMPSFLTSEISLCDKYSYLTPGRYSGCQV